MYDPHHKRPAEKKDSSADKLVQTYRSMKPATSWFDYWQKHWRAKQAEQLKAAEQLKKEQQAEKKENPGSIEQKEQSEPPKRRVIRINRQQLNITLVILLVLVWYKFWLASL